MSNLKTPLVKISSPSSLSPIPESPERLTATGVVISRGQPLQKQSSRPRIRIQRNAYDRLTLRHTEQPPTPTRTLEQHRQAVIESTDSDLVRKMAETFPARKSRSLTLRQRFAHLKIKIKERTARASRRRSRRAHSVDGSPTTLRRKDIENKELQRNLALLRQDHSCLSRQDKIDRFFDIINDSKHPEILREAFQKVADIHTLDASASPDNIEETAQSAISVLEKTLSETTLSPARPLINQIRALEGMLAKEHTPQRLDLIAKAATALLPLGIDSVFREFSTKLTKMAPKLLPSATRTAALTLLQAYLGALHSRKPGLARRLLPLLNALHLKAMDADIFASLKTEKGPSLKPLVTVILGSEKLTPAEKRAVLLDTALALLDGIDVKSPSPHVESILALFPDKSANRVQANKVFSSGLKAFVESRFDTALYLLIQSRRIGSEHHISEEVRKTLEAYHGGQGTHSGIGDHASILIRACNQRSPKKAPKPS